jgi:hypothetical protein
MAIFRRFQANHISANMRGPARVDAIGRALYSAVAIRGFTLGIAFQLCNTSTIGRGGHERA